MAAASIDRPYETIDNERDGLLAKLTMLAAEINYVGTIIAVDYLKEAQAATDTEGLQVVGWSPKQVDNTADGKTLDIRNDIIRMDNDATYPFVADHSSRGLVAFVADDQTVATRSTNYVPAGLVHDVNSDGVFVDMSPRALRMARDLMPLKSVARTTDYDISAEATGGPILFSRRYVWDWADADGTGLLSLCTAVPGMKFGLRRTLATAGRDPTVKADTSDLIQGSDAYAAAGKIVENTVDLVEFTPIFWEAVDAIHWAISAPHSGTWLNWVKNDA